MAGALQERGGATLGSAPQGDSGRVAGRVCEAAALNPLPARPPCPLIRLQEKAQGEEGERAADELYSLALLGALRSFRAGEFRPGGRQRGGVGRG